MSRPFCAGTGLLEGPLPPQRFVAPSAATRYTGGVESLQRGVHRVGVVVAVVLIAHLFMLHTAGHGHPETTTAYRTSASAPLPSAGGCPIGMSACHVVELDGSEPLGLPVDALLLSTLVVAAALLRRHAAHRVRRDDRHPPGPRVPSSVVLLQ